MIKEFVAKFDAARPALLAEFKGKHPSDYKDIVTAVVRALSDVYGYDNPDPERIHEINDGSYQGTLVYVIGSNDYSPSEYWYTKVSYGSCSGCDTLCNIQGYDTETPPTDEQAADYLTLALHIVQRLRKMEGDGYECEQV